MIVTPVSGLLEVNVSPVHGQFRWLAVGIEYLHYGFAAWGAIELAGDRGEIVSAASNVYSRIARRRATMACELFYRHFPASAWQQRSGRYGATRCD